MSISKVLSLLENLTKEKNYPSYGNKHMLSDFNVSWFWMETMMLKK